MPRCQSPLPLPLRLEGLLVLRPRLLLVRLRVGGPPRVHERDCLPSFELRALEGLAPDLDELEGSLVDPRALGVEGGGVVAYELQVRHEAPPRQVVARGRALEHRGEAHWPLDDFEVARGHGLRDRVVEEALLV